jgi:hypothetical protein
MIFNMSPGVLLGLLSNALKVFKIKTITNLPGTGGPREPR